MEQGTALLTIEEAADFAGVNVPTINRYTSAGFLVPAKVVDGIPKFSEKDLIQVFELSPKRATARKKIAGKKKANKKATVLTEKDRLIAEKDIQIRDLKDQREWLRARVEKLEQELLNAQQVAENHTPAPETSEEEQVADITPVLLPEEEAEQKEEARKVSTLSKLLRYFGFVEASEAIEDSREELEAEVLESTPLESADAAGEEQTRPALKASEIGARPFRRVRSGGSNSDLLDLLGTPVAGKGKVKEKEKREDTSRELDKAEN